MCGMENLQQSTNHLFGTVLRYLEVDCEITCIRSELCIQEGLGQDYSKYHFFVAVLTDAFLNNEDHIQHISKAIYSGKCIVPLLVLEKKAWSGACDKSYWKHFVQHVHSPVLNWMVLENFEPLIFSSEAESDLIALAAAIGDRTRRLMERIGKRKSYSDISLLGVKLSYFEKFIKDCGGRQRFIGKTTEWVLETYVKPLTVGSKLSLCEQLHAKGDQVSMFVGRAECFYSHAWKFLFLDVVDAAKNHFQDQDPFIWFDLFSVSQHKAEIRPFEWWNVAFFNTISEIRTVLMLMQPFEDSETGTEAWTTLTRVWCVFELYCCQKSGCNFQVTMTPKMKKLVR